MVHALRSRQVSMALHQLRSIVFSSRLLLILGWPSEITRTLHSERKRSWIKLTQQDLAHIKYLKQSKVQITCFINVRVWSIRITHLSLRAVLSSRYMTAIWPDSSPLPKRWAPPWGTGSLESLTSLELIGFIPGGIGTSPLDNLRLGNAILSTFIRLHRFHSKVLLNTASHAAHHFWFSWIQGYFPKY